MTDAIALDRPYIAVYRAADKAAVDVQGAALRASHATGIIREPSGRCWLYFAGRYVGQTDSVQLARTRLGWRSQG